jgi:UDPglucose--hexose-1-phosphate uridylyltransferase
VSNSDEQELRLDLLTREWVAIVGQRQSRPNLPDPTGCPFCVGGLEAPEPYEVRAFPNRWPVFLPGDVVSLGAGAIRVPARGAAEIVLYTPDHTASMASLGARGVRRVIDLWADRTAALLARPEVDYVLVFENRGREVGATIDHPHGQVYAFGLMPPVPRKELDVAAAHGCPLCELTSREATLGERVVVDDGEWLAWVPFASGWPYGLLIAPRDHLTGLPDARPDTRDGLAHVLVDALARYDRLFARAFPYMLWIHQLPGNEHAHLHIHIAPPLRAARTMRFVAAAELGSGVLFDPVTPEHAAAALRHA